MSKISRQRGVISLVVMASVVLAVRHPAKAEAQGGAPSDPQIVGIVVAADNIDIDYGKLATSKTKDKQVRDFAQQMIADHSSVQKSVNELAAKLNVSPEDSETSNSLKADAQQMMQKLQAMKGKQFDRAYIDNEVAYHQAVINATKNVLIPNAQNNELKSALQGAVPLFEGHLQHAERVQSAIEAGNGPRSRASGGQARNSEGTAPRSVSTIPGIVTVVIRDFKFDPFTVTVHQGDTVQWMNHDNVPHTATEDVEGKKPVFDSGNINTGTSWHYVAQKKGSYKYVCTLHPNMQGTLIVQ